MTEVMRWRVPSPSSGAGPAPRLIERLGPHRFRERLAEIGAELREIALHPAVTADQHVIGAADAVIGKDVSGERAKAALHAVADDRVADLLGDGEADPHGGIGVASVADQQHEARHGLPPARVRRQEILAAGENA